MQNYLQVEQPWSLVAGPRDPRSGVRLLGSRCWFLSRLGTWSGLGCPKACVGLLVVRAEVQLIPGHGLACYGQAGFTGCLTGFLTSGVCPLVGKANSEPRVGSLESKITGR